MDLREVVKGVYAENKTSLLRDSEESLRIQRDGGPSLLT
jgi:hypothetical protein